MTPATAITPPASMLAESGSSSSDTPKTAPNTGTRLLKITVRAGGVLALIVIGTTLASFWMRESRRRRAAAVTAEGHP